MRKILMMLTLKFLLTLDIFAQIQYVDLGLPSGLLWAKCNVGAKNPWDCGYFFAWGETKPKSVYSWATYKYAKNVSANRVYYRTINNLTKYCSKSDCGYNKFTDNLTELSASDDAATVNLGDEWRTPTHQEWKELIENCIWEKITNYEGSGIGGYIARSRKYKSRYIFLPATGNRWEDRCNGKNEYASYWSATLRTVSNPCEATSFHININDGSSINIYNAGCASTRYHGYQIRAVRNGLSCINDGNIASNNNSNQSNVSSSNTLPEFYKILRENQNNMSVEELLSAADVCILQKDYDNAFNCYKLAADKGSTIGMYNLAICYLKGDGCTEDYDKFLFYLKKAATGGNLEAIYKWGVLYERQGNIDAALNWYVIAAQAGHKEAKEALRRLSNQ